MKQFDYARAWKEKAYPAFLALDPAARALVDRVHTECAEIFQDSTLNVPWPEAGDLRQAFAAIPEEPLAIASAVVYDAGHWAPGGPKVFPYQAHGTYWKFSNYADQSLSERLGMKHPHAHTAGNGVTIRCQQGLLRVGWSTPYSWQAAEVALATEPAIAALQSAPRPKMPTRGRQAWDEWADRVEAWAAERRAELGPGPELAWLIDISPYMVEEPARVAV